MTWDAQGMEYVYLNIYKFTAWFLAACLYLRKKSTVGKCKYTSLYDYLSPRHFY